MIPEFMTAQEVRKVDRVAIDRYGLPGVVLMENAARGCVKWLVELGIRGKVVICAGRGNNGGDGFVMARHLENAGHDVQVVLFCDPAEVTGDAAINLAVLKKSGTPLRVLADEENLAEELQTILSDADWIVDALLGTGTRGSLRRPFLDVISEINASTAKKMAIDLPSGLDCDLGAPVDESGLAVRADVTATFVTKKAGFANAASSAFVGEIRVIDIGVPRAMFSD